MDAGPLENALRGDRALLDALGPNRDNEGAMTAFLTRHNALIASTLGGRSGDAQQWIGNFIGFFIAAQVMRVSFLAN